MANGKTVMPSQLHRIHVTEAQTVH
jgi:hypothetical protein